MPDRSTTVLTSASGPLGAFMRLMMRLGPYASLLLGITSIVLVWFGAVYGINRERDDTERAALANGANLARAFEEQLIRSLRAVDQTILYVRDSYARDPATFDISLWSKNSQFLTDFNFQIAIIDKDGFLAASNIDPNAARVDLSDREHFKVHRNGTADVLFISKPLLGRVSNKWSVQITRRIILPDGSFGGVVVVSLDPGYLGRFYESIDTGASGTVTLVGTDGIIRARAARGQVSQGVGQSLNKSVLFETLAKAPEGHYTTAAVVDGIARIYAYRTVKGYPLVVTVGQGRNEVLASFENNRRSTLIIASFISAWIVVVLLLVQRYQTGLAQARDAAEAGTRARSEFLAMMSHEIRTPMNGVIGIADLLADSGLKDSQRKMVDTLRESAQHLLQIINDVLDFTKLDSETTELESIPLEPAQIVQSAVHLFAPPATIKGVTLRVAIASDVPARVLGDPARIRQVLFNLVGNAVKFTPSGSVTIALARGVPAGDDHEQLVFSVTDTGIGIPEEARVRLFKEFSQVDSSIARRFGGTGLGLAICKRLVERMNGTIDVSSEVGQGSTFRFTVQVAPQAVTEIEAPALVPALPPAAPRRRLRILLAEDNLTNQMVATKIIEKIDHDVTVVSNGAQALARVQSGAFDLVLMDVMMPEIDGLTATRTIRKLPSDVRNIYIIALTANALRKDDEMCRAAGMNDFVAKPVTRARLEEALDRYFEYTAIAAPDGVAQPEITTEARSTMTFDDITAFDPVKLDELRNEIGEDGAAEVLGTFFDDTAQRIEVMRVALRAGDRASLENEAHAMKSSAATFGFMRLSALAKALEAQSRMAMPADAPVQMEQIAAAFADVCGLALTEQRAA